MKIGACKCDRRWLLKRSFEILSLIIFATLLARLFVSTARRIFRTSYKITTHSHLDEQPTIKNLGNNQCLTCSSGRDGQVAFIMDEVVY